MHGKQVKATMSDIAAITRQPIDTVRRHHREGWFSMDDFKAVVVYTQAQMALGLIEPVSARREVKDVLEQNTD